MCSIDLEAENHLYFVFSIFLLVTLDIVLENYKQRTADKIYQQSNTHSFLTYHWIKHKIGSQLHSKNKHWDILLLPVPHLQDKSLISSITDWNRPNCWRSKVMWLRRLWMKSYLLITLVSAELSKTILMRWAFISITQVPAHIEKLVSEKQL
jgi:hypothetical protein